MTRGNGDGKRHRVVIIGGGFGGLFAAYSLRRAPVEVTVVDRRNFHLFQPLLYQVATGGLSPGDICSPIRWVLRKQRNTRVLLGEAASVEADRRCVRLRDGEALPYDTLIVAAGASHHYFGHSEWAAIAPGLKTVEDATEMRRRILSAFEAAERETDPEERRALLNFVVVGGGPTGVELAGALSELSRDTLKGDFRSIDPSEARILLLEGLDRVLAGYPDGLSIKAKRSLEKLGVEVRLGSLVREVDERGVSVESEGRRTRIPTRCVLWAAGVRASPVGEMVAKGTGAALDRVGRVIVEPDCSVAGHENVFVIGDLANFSHAEKGRWADQPLPGVAPVAMQQGRHVARTVVRRLAGKPLAPFRYVDKGSMATIGRSKAVADLRVVRFSGFFAWLLWMGVHVLFLVEFENRVLVLFQWAYNYFTRNRGARLIAGGPYEVAPEARAT